MTFLDTTKTIPAQKPHIAFIQGQQLQKSMFEWIEKKQYLCYLSEDRTRGIMLDPARYAVLEEQSELLLRIQDRITNQIQIISFNPQAESGKPLMLCSVSFPAVALDAGTLCRYTPYD